MAATTPDGLCAALRAADLLRPGTTIDLCVAAARRRLDEEAMDAVGSPRGLLDLALTATCIICAALAAGLTMGVVSLDPLDLRVKMRTGTKSEQACAARLLPLVDRRPHHQVLVTLLLLNSCANEALPLFLDKLVPSWAAIVISVTAVLVFGEIAPSALFTGPNKLQIAAAFAPLVHCFLVVLAPLAYPMALALDAALHEEAKATSRAEVLALVDVERELANEDGRAEPFTEDEADLVRGAMSLSTTSVREVMVPLKRVYAVDEGDALDAALLEKIDDQGFSRVPVKVGGAIRSYVLVKELVPRALRADASASLPVATLPTHAPVWVSPDHSLFDLLNQFQTGATHMGFVAEDAAGRRGILGIVTLEDIIEEILTEEIYDEHDRDKAEDVIGRFVRRAFPKVFENKVAAPAEQSLLEGREDSVGSYKRRGFGERARRGEPGPYGRRPRGLSGPPGLRRQGSGAVDRRPPPGHHRHPHARVMHRPQRDASLRSILGDERV